VEAKAVGRDERTLLVDLLAQHDLERLVEQMRAGVVAADRVAPLGVHAALARVARLRRALALVPPEVQPVAALRLAVGHLERAVREDDLARVADLAARFRVERRTVEDERRLLARTDLHVRLVAQDDADEAPLGERAAA